MCRGRGGGGRGGRCDRSRPCLRLPLHVPLLLLLLQAAQLLVQAGSCAAARLQLLVACLQESLLLLRQSLQPGLGLVRTTQLLQQLYRLAVTLLQSERRGAGGASKAGQDRAGQGKAGPGKERHGDA